MSVMLSGLFLGSLGRLKWGLLGALGGWPGVLASLQVPGLEKRRRLGKFEKQLPDALELLARGLKAGHAFVSGLQLVADEMGPPIGPEFFKTFKEHNHGLDLNAALLNLCRRIDLPDLRFFTTAVMIQRETGGNLAEILDKIASPHPRALQADQSGHRPDRGRQAFGARPHSAAPRHCLGPVFHQPRLY